jgi:hypothetical protein
MHTGIRMSAARRRARGGRRRAFLGSALALLVVATGMVVVARPRPVSAALSAPIRIDANNGSTCVVLGDGGVKCWGLTTSILGFPTTLPTTVEGLSAVHSVGVGHFAACGLLLDETVRCWGDNNSGQLGIAHLGGGVAPAVPLPPVQQLAVGANHACALLVDGSIQCWGSNQDSQLGTNRALFNSSVAPVAVPEITDAVAVSSGGSHSCALLANGTVKCWGGHWTELYNAEYRPSPILVDGLAGVASIDAGIERTCARLVNGTVRCWGYPGQGTLYLEPPIEGVTTALEVSTAFGFSCALLSDTTVRCWGPNQYGQVGDGTTTDVRYPPVQVSGLSGVSEVTVGLVHACALLTSGGVRCWGNNENGQLGIGTTTNQPLPVDVVGVTGTGTSTTTTTSSTPTSTTTTVPPGSLLMLSAPRKLEPLRDFSVKDGGGCGTGWTSAPKVTLSATLQGQTTPFFSWSDMPVDANGRWGPVMMSVPRDVGNSLSVIITASCRSSARTVGYANLSIPLQLRSENYNWWKMTELESARKAYGLSLDKFLIEAQSPYHDPRLEWSNDLCSGPTFVDYFWEDNFEPACIRHDFGYRNFGSTKALNKTGDQKTVIDDQFLEDMNRACRGMARIPRYSCQTSAALWYEGVHFTSWGHNAFFG